MELKLVITFIHFIGVILGVGSAITSSFLFFRTVRDRKITEDELDILTITFRILWSGFLITLLSGLAFFWFQYTQYGAISYFQSQPFLAKMTIFFLLYLVSLIFHYKVLPLLRIADTEDAFREAVEKNTTLFAFIGATTAVSWIYLLVLGSFREITPQFMTYEKALGLYLVLSLFATLFTYFILRRDNLERELSI